MVPFDAAKPRSKTKSPSMSLEQALFEEEQEVLALIGAKTNDPLPPPPPPIGSTGRGGSVAAIRTTSLQASSANNAKTARSSSVATANRRDVEGLLSPQAYQFGVGTNALNRAADTSSQRRKSAPSTDHHRRSSSPGGPRPIGLMQPRNMSPPPQLPSTQLPSFDKAYRRLSNAAMAQSGGSLSRLAQRSPRSSLSQEKVVRLEKDKDPDSVIESSSDDDTETDGSRPTSRTQSPSLKPTHHGRSASQDEMWVETKHNHVPLSLSAAADQESRAVASIVGPFSGPGPRPLSQVHAKRRMGRDPSKPKRVFPSTNFDSSKVSTDASGAESTPNRDEEARKAARSAIHESPILSSPDRTVVTLLRGEFAEMESAGEFPRQRTYLVSSDLSPQATYAMEWTIGTVLREGDVLFVAQALGKDDEPCEERDREANCRTLVEEVRRLLKRTRLQVKVHIEIVAAKTPKHMITEMIDYINPTMVILGSRGRSAVKNILLGSFSTYLVAKSSCPVMVARKKLKKSHRKGVSAASLASSTIHGGLTGVSSIQAARMANNLNLLANAIVDEKDLKRR